MLLPIGDDDRALTSPAYVTLAVLVLNLVVFFLLQGAGSNDAFTYGWSVIPKEIVEGVDLVRTQVVQAGGQRAGIPQAPGPNPIYLTILSAMFMHGGFAHLFGNLLYLWIFGDNVEHRLGTGRFLVFYLACGLAATVAQIALNPQGVVPNLGASGAISGVLGAYITFFPHNRVHALFFYLVVSVPAYVAIGLWIGFQFVNGFGSIMEGAALGGVAYGAHLGGFAAGVAVAAAVRFFGEAPAVRTEREAHDRLLRRYESRESDWG